MSAENESNINAGHSLGKGEVDSSILSGSTKYHYVCWDSEEERWLYSATIGRTEREEHASTRGESVDFVHGSIREDSMPDDRKSPFELALEEAVFGCLGLGVHPTEMIEAMERKAADLKEMLRKLPG
jgi:hypothetical protein